jgi:hypothetical protein
MRERNWSPVRRPYSTARCSSTSRRVSDRKLYFRRGESFCSSPAIRPCRRQMHCNAKSSDSSTPIVNGERTRSLSKSAKLASKSKSVCMRSRSRASPRSLLRLETRTGSIASSCGMPHGPRSAEMCHCVRLMNIAHSVPKLPFTVGPLLKDADTGLRPCGEVCGC